MIEIHGDGPPEKHRWFQLTDAELTRLNPPFLAEIEEDEDDNEWERHYHDDKWWSMGVVPTPKTRLGWFCHHVMHGLMMRYPWHKVLGWSFWYSFIEPLAEMEEIDYATR